MAKGSNRYLLHYVALYPHPNRRNRTATLQRNRVIHNSSSIFAVQITLDDCSSRGNGVTDRPSPSSMVKSKRIIFFIIHDNILLGMLLFNCILAATRASHGAKQPCRGIPMSRQHHAHKRKRYTRSTFCPCYCNLAKV